MLGTEPLEMLQNAELPLHLSKYVNNEFLTPKLGPVNMRMCGHLLRRATSFRF
jgi:hypothetical protein